MSFIQPCFIRKNTPELRKKLEELGYKYSTFDDFKLDGIITFPSRNEYSVWANYHFDGKHTLKSYIDCSDNEELFLALAALRDNSDRNQWFIYDEDTSFLQKGDWYMCSLNHHLSPSHKATVEELIEHFKTK